ncbi:hypothetical protein WICPIJ_003804 [Wickerhamomyces pijperi]|uniref:Uncharacterized protein n=1 Tax=Wickerhamomyces pijperi TaxID=599730 RepID=A0A9P8Q946_WICPI|nr:hypothetical protein WICPIJ_003804 [Wickerhamomyces pijperi]
MKLDKLWSKRDMRYSRHLTSDLITSDDLPITSQDDTVLFQSIPLLDCTLDHTTTHLKVDGPSKRLSKVCDLPIRVKTIMGKDHVKRRVISTPANFKVPELPALERLYITEPPSAKLPSPTLNMMSSSIPEVEETQHIQPVPAPLPISKQADFEKEMEQEEETIQHRKVRSRDSSKLDSYQSSLRHTSMPQPTSYSTTYSSNRISNARVARPQAQVLAYDDERPRMATTDYANIIQIYLESKTNISDYRPPLPPKNTPTLEKLNQLEEQLGLMQEDLESQFSFPESLTSGSGSDEDRHDNSDASTINSIEQLNRFTTANENIALTPVRESNSMHA